ncbi:MAG: PEGA domain-containing protein, partial [Deltaproteobacteria bacterium]
MLLAAHVGLAGGRDAQLVVLGLRGIGVDHGEVKKTEKMLVEAARTHSGMKLMAPHVVSARLRDKGILPGASWGKLHAALGVKFALTGTLAAFGEELTMDLKLVKAEDGRTVRQATAQIPRDASKRKSVLDELVVRLCRPADWVGSLELVVAEPDAAVFIDGKEVARTPLEKPLTGLSPGKHILRIVKDGFDEFSRFVEIRYGQRVRVEVDLKNNMLVGMLYEKRGKPQQQNNSLAPAPAVQERVVWRGREFMNIVAISAASGGAAIG